MKHIATILTVMIAVTPMSNAQWTKLNVTSNDQNTYALISDGNNIYAGTGGAGVYLSSNCGSSWNAANNGLTSTGISSFAINGSNIFAGANDGLYLSTNSGGLWTAKINGLTNTNVNALAINGTNLFAGTNGGIFLSTDNGSNWKAVNNGFSGQVVALASSGTNTFLGTGNYGVYLSTNNGGLWTAKNKGLTNTVINTLAINGTNIFAGTEGGGIFLSTNNGEQWTGMNNGLTNMKVYSFLFNGTKIFAGTGGGVFVSDDNGSNWTAVNDGFSASNTVWTFAICGTDIFVGFHLQPYGVWKRPLSEIPTNIEEKNGNSSITIYPNPASDIVNINIIKNNCAVTYTIYNVLGSLIKTEKLEQDKQQFSVKELSSGIYMVEIKAKGLSLKQKLLIVK